MEQGQQPDRALWRFNHWVWIGIALVVLLAFQSLIWGPKREELKYSQFKIEVAQGTVSEVKVGEHKITGILTRTNKSGDEERVAFHTPRRGLAFDQSLYELLATHNVDYGGDNEPSRLVTGLVYMLPFIMVIGVFLLMMRRLGGGGSAMAFARSRAKMYGDDDVQVTFSDVAGIDEAVDELKEVVEFLKTPEKYHALGGKIPKGVLLVGPPGTGKTLLAKAVAGEAGVPFFSLSGSDFVELFVGVGAARVRDLFQQAEAKAPSIVFIDELDALGKARGSASIAGHDEREQTLNQLLVQMDGFDSNRGVIIMAATNRPETLDPALLRPGRFDRNVVVDRPDVNGRTAILEVHSRNVKVAPNLNLREIAGLTPGFAGADLANLINEAALLAARAGESDVHREHIEDGIERVVAGLEKRGRVILPEEKRRVAVHEAGHALVSLLVPQSDPVHKVSIIPRGSAALGYTLHRPQDDKYLSTQTQLESKIKVLLAGSVAERELLDETSSGAQNDFERATAIARQMVMLYGMSPKLGRVCYQETQTPSSTGFSNTGEAICSETTSREIDEEVRRIIEDGSAAVKKLLTDHRETLQIITDRLIEAEVLDAAQLRSIVEQGTAPQQPVA